MGQLHAHVINMTNIIYSVTVSFHKYDKIFASDLYEL